jgi:hypothetical protein
LPHPLEHLPPLLLLAGGRLVLRRLAGAVVEEKMLTVQRPTIRGVEWARQKRTFLNWLDRYSFHACMSRQHAVGFE